MLQEKINLSIEQTTKKYTCSECIEESTTFLAELRELVIRIMHPISISVALVMPNLITNSSASKVVI